MTKVEYSLDDLISILENQWTAGYEITGAHDGIDEAILSTLRAHKAIMEAKRPEPVAWILPGDDIVKDNGWIDARCDRWGEFTKPLYGPDLLAYADRMADMAQRLEQWYAQEKQKVRMETASHDSTVMQLKQAERQLAELQAKHDALVKRLREPGRDLLTACGRRLLRFQDGSTDESFSGLQWAEVRQDAARVLAEFSAVALREGDE